MACGDDRATLGALAAALVMGCAGAELPCLDHDGCEWGGKCVNGACVGGMPAPSTQASAPPPEYEGAPRTGSELARHAAARLCFEARAALQIPRGNLGLVAVDGRLFAIGGTTGEAVSVVEMYEPATDTWSFRAPMAHPREGAAIAAVGDTIYVFGGFGGRGYDSGSLRDRIGAGESFRGDVEAYDVPTNTWRSLPRLPVHHIAQVSPVAVTIGAEIFLLNGVDGEGMWAFDTESETWASLPGTPITDVQSAVKDGTVVYAASGPGWARSVSGGGAELARLDLSTSRWTTLSRLPHELFVEGPQRGRLAQLDSRLYYVGSSVDFASGAPTEVAFFEPSTGTWSVAGSLGSVRHAFGVATLDGKIYVAGGFIPRMQYAQFPTDTLEVSCDP